MSSINSTDKNTSHNLNQATRYKTTQYNTLQSIKIHDKDFTIFYDTGCGDMVCKNSAVERLAKKALQECKGPVWVGGVAGVLKKLSHSIYQEKLSIFSRTEAILSAVRLINN